LQLREYFRAAVVQRRAKPENDLLSLLIHAEDDGHKLDDEELLANAHLLMVAGHETTTNLIANGLHAMLRHPDQFQKLRADPTLVPSAVEESLRYESPVQFLTRLIKKDMTIAGKPFRPGQSIDVVLGAANRDPAQFPDPDRFDVTRSPNKHLAFGGGAHFCLGTFLARLEGAVAFETLLRRFPNMELAPTTVTYRENFNLRGPKVVPVRF
jgi:cytochrome P450